MNGSNLDRVLNVLPRVREKVPLVHCITNHVTINDCANILLSYGASPAMCEAYDEVFDFVKISQALYINLGTLNKEQEASVVLAAQSAKINNIPVILDPVACAAIPKKVQVINRIFEVGKVDIIKGNIGEINFLAGKSSKVKGVDSLDSSEGALESCITLSKKYNCTVAATGKEDFITNGRESAIVQNGTDMLTKITGAGCMLGALCGAAAGACDDNFIAATAAILSMNIAAEEAFKQAKAPGSFRVKLIDSIYELNYDKLKEGEKIIWK
ncbi:MAG: hydroxyethylthiazole kinase [Clostridium sp.]|jgi:hydroxyethylthiazole kinase|uniref:hydroxyethylthiazole kinase n=1 Tax=Clostridium sp. TaxID=1506 RepID=UPI0025BB322C|nr:hydroxyethylthiazole kinase [Clostridium sp.]MCH3964760.1 hydroxyethylthiazole kinase [Clostridium sp.]MCI1715231.1 hydroxyethylthiazole kinase [Clostridium sp.]MCI1799493.1 hydroxyethylthiazole kinase [Clostridium sp.]MCI1813414.1 hydroxyethylthiazole kinase [Clostridium sp.]MCI1870305.1 hydroxyethylthiazole kinase [Clostridium sp.]